jgi:hypothetical protein
MYVYQISMRQVMQVQGPNITFQITSVVMSSMEVIIKTKTKDFPHIGFVYGFHISIKILA